MGLSRPPRHRVDAEPVYVDPGDEAWDRERLTKEMAALEEAAAAATKAAEEAAAQGKTPIEHQPETHPVVMYWSGLTRFDLQAPARLLGEDRRPEDWIDDTKGPWRFRLRRLNGDQYHEVVGRIEKERREQLAANPNMDPDPNQAMLKACRFGLVSVDGTGSPDLRSGARGYLSDADMEKLHDVDPYLAVRIGRAVWISSQPLLVSEKKA